MRTLTEDTSLLKRVLLASPRRQLMRLRYLLQLVWAKVFGDKDFKEIKIVSKGDVYLGTYSDGFQWHVPENNPMFVAWARKFIEKKVRFENRGLLRHGDVVINVGACTGEYTTHAATKVGNEGKVFAFEPDPAFFACLKANMALRSHNNVLCINMAVSDTNNSIKLHRIETAVAGGSVDNQYYNDYKERITSSLTVDGTTIDAFYKNENSPIRLMVVTVNNHELAVLKGAINTIKITDYIIYQSINHKAITEFLVNNSFQLVEELYQEGSDDEHIALFRNLFA